MNVLAIDTAGPVIGVALVCGESVVLRTERVERGAEARLVPWALELCAEAGISLSQLDGLASVRGPGAFTGIRVGLATAAGLAMSLSLPLWTTDSLASRAQRVAGPVVVAMLDARKGRVYAARWGGGSVVLPPADIAPEAALADLAAGFVATGEGALVYEPLVRAAGGHVAADADHPAVDTLARLADAGLARGEGDDATSVTPLYLRDADAQLPKGR